MGCYSSKIYPTGSDALFRDLYLVGLSNSDINNLIVVFKNADINKNGSLDIHEVYSYFSIDDNPFMVPIFNEVTRKHPKQVNTREFILCLWRFLTRDEPSMIEFMFQVFDTKRERGLRLKAFHDIIVYAYGREGADEKLTGILSKIPNRQDDALLSQEKIRYNLDQFRVAVRASPHIIQNALQLQTALRSKIMGLAFWKKHSAVCLSNPNAQALFKDPYDVHSAGNSEVLNDSNVVVDSNGEGMQSNSSPMSTLDNIVVKQPRKHDIHSSPSKEAAIAQDQQLGGKPLRRGSKDFRSAGDVIVAGAPIKLRTARADLHSAVTSDAHNNKHGAHHDNIHSIASKDNADQQFAGKTLHHHRTMGDVKLTSNATKPRAERTDPHSATRVVNHQKSTEEGHPKRHGHKHDAHSSPSKEAASAASYDQQFAGRTLHHHHTTGDVRLGGSPNKLKVEQTDNTKNTRRPSLNLTIAEGGSLKPIAQIIRPISIDNYNSASAGQQNVSPVRVRRNSVEIGEVSGKFHMDHIEKISSQMHVRRMST